MRVTHLSLSDFRNYELAETQFHAGCNLLLGRNGQGKTNLVEAIGYFSGLDSHRVHGDGALIRRGAESATMRMRIAVGKREALLEVQLNRARPKRAQLNHQPVQARELTRWFSCVVFAPEDLQLVRGEPAVRRRFLDEAVTARNPVFRGVLDDYDRVLRQRSALLKAARSGNRAAAEATLSVWDERLIELGTTIMLERRSLLASLAAPLQYSYGAIVEQDHTPRCYLQESVSLSLVRDDVSRETLPESPMVGGVTNESNTGGSETDPREQQVTAADVSRETITAQFRQALMLLRSREFERGANLVGPHRDDVLCELNGLPVKGYASHGESWSFVLSLRLALAELLRQESAYGDPVIILDDVFAELDAKRRQALMACVSGFEQVIVTAAVAEDVPPGEWHTHQIRAGRVLDSGAQDVSIK